MLALARVVRLVAGIVFLILAVGILLRVLGANPGNTIVSDIHDAGRWLAGPFRNVFSVKNAKESIALNWGLAAIVYLIVGGFIATLLARLSTRGPRVRSAQPVV